MRPVEDYPERLLETLQYIAPDGRARSDRRAADAGHLQLGLFRALVPGPADGRRAGQGSDLVVTDGYVYMRTTQRPAARRRDLSPHRRRFPRSARAASRFGAGRAGLDGCLSRGPRGAGQRAGHRHRRRQGRLRLRAADHQVLPGRRHAAAERADVRLRGRQAVRSTCWRTSTSWSSNRPTSRAATASCWARWPRRANATSSAT